MDSLKNPTKPHVKTFLLEGGKKKKGFAAGMSAPELGLKFGTATSSVQLG